MTKYEKGELEKNELYESNLSVIYSMIYLYECRDESSGSHLARIGVFSKILAAELANNNKYQDYIDAEYLKTIEISSMLHDIGKLGVSESILNKNGTLNFDELIEIKKHPVLGAEKMHKLMEHFPGNPWYEMSACIIRSHHERFDGKGYPDGLKGDDIPLSARIVAIGDVYDALRSKRPYKPAFSHSISVETIKQGSGTHFDPDIVKAFLNVEWEFEKIYSLMENI